MLKGQFAFRKWITNDQKLQLFIDVKENENIVQNSTYGKVLGLHWFTENDSFKYNFTNITNLGEELPTTTRNILKSALCFTSH